MVINRIEKLVTNKQKLYKTLKEINSSSASSLNKLNKELEQIENRLLEIQQLQDKYMEAFEKNTLPIDILQERLQKVSNEKRELEQKKNEIAVHLSSFDSKVIQSELIEMLLENFYSLINRHQEKIKNSYFSY